MKKKISKKDDRSIKTFFLYALIVLFFIFASLTIKTVSLLRQSKYDGRHFVLSINRGEKVEKIVGFSPSDGAGQASLVSNLDIKDSELTSSTLGQELGLIPDANLTIASDAPANLDTASILTKTLWNPQSAGSDLTFIDKARLILFSKNANVTAQEIRLPAPSNKINEIIKTQFSNDDISSENVTVQIINATEISGLGQRMERIVLNMGGNVVAVSTSRNRTPTSQIQYFGEITYTLKKFEKLFNFPIKKETKKPIADIVIIIGEDSQDTLIF